MTFRNQTSLAAIMIAAGPSLLWAQDAAAQDSAADDGANASGGIEEILVTATKRVASTQDIPVAVSALSGERLEELDVDVFTDYLQQLPGVTSGGAGPGQNTIYIRGLASTTPQIGTAAVAGLAPNVALYLDEQPLAQPGRNLDIYAVDMQRVEVLSGPQGTLFGASSQAGTIRLITNKPQLDEFSARANMGVSFTRHGEMSTKVEGIINMPVTDKFAVRAVAYVDDQGGFIDNVPGSVDLSASARFRAAGSVRANGIPVDPVRAGFQGNADLSAVNFLPATNDGLVEDDFNDAQYAGFRVSALYEFSDDWRLTAAHARQTIEADGVFFIDPESGDEDGLSISRFEDEFIEEDFSNTSWTLEGRLGMLEMVYTGAYAEREADQRVDYTDYLYVGQFLPYYLCDSTVSYPGAADPSGTCQPPNLYTNIDTETTVQTHELRFNTPAENRWRLTVGGFYSDLQIDERVDFNYPGAQNANVFGSLGFSENFPLPASFASEPLVFAPDTIFRNDVRRTDEQLGLFGEASFDLIPDRLSVTFGSRYYDVEVDLEGSASGSFCNSNAAGPDAQAFGTNISDLYDGDGQFRFNASCNTAIHQVFDTSDTIDSVIAATGISEAAAQRVINSINAPDKATTDGFIFKGNVSYTPNDDMLFYATYSEGFRPGQLNRPGGAVGAGGFVVPYEIDTDEVTNYEIGWKLDLLDGQLRFNGNAFFVDVESLQVVIFDPNITNLLFSDNGADAEIYGIEGDLSYAPASIPGLTLFAAFSVLDTEITEVLLPTNDILEGADLAFAPSFSGNIRARYGWEVGEDLQAYVQAQLVHTGAQRSDIIEINAAPIDSWTTLGVAAGIRKDRWSVDLFIENLTDSRAQLTNSFPTDVERTAIIRPMTVGLRFGFGY